MRRRNGSRLILGIVRSVNSRIIGRYANQNEIYRLIGNQPRDTTILANLGLGRHFHISEAYNSQPALVAITCQILVDEFKG